MSVNAAPIGAAFTFLALLTGSLWGRPMWGTYWVWDARLASVLVLILVSAALGMVSPFLLRAVLDDAIPHNDTQLLAGLATARV